MSDTSSFRHLRTDACPAASSFTRQALSRRHSPRPTLVRPLAAMSVTPRRLRPAWPAILRIAPADCRRRAVATVRGAGFTVDRRSITPGCAASFAGSPARARGGVQNDRRSVGCGVDPARARLPLPGGG